MYWQIYSSVSHKVCGTESLEVVAKLLIIGEEAHQPDVVLVVPFGCF